MVNSSGRFLSLSICLVGLIVFARLGHAPVAALAINVLMVASAAILGAFAMRRLVPDDTSALGQFVIGAVVVLTLGRMLLMGVGLFVRADLAAYGMLAASVAGSLLVLRSVRSGGTVTSAEAASARQIFWLSAGLFVLMGLAFRGVGAATATGFAFPSYFNHDFLQHVSVVAELTRGVPPVNPYMNGAELHYYWFYHLWPAAVAAMAHTSAIEAMTATAPFAALLFVGMLMTVVSVGDVRARSLAIAVSLFAPSLLGLLACVSIAAPALFAKLPLFGAPGFSFISHTWYRDTLYESHALTALSMAMAVFYLGRPARGRVTMGNVIVRGILLGMMFMTDAVIALVVTAFFGLESIVHLVREPTDRVSTVMLGVALVATVAVTVAVGAVPLQGGTLTLGLHRTAFIAPVYLMIEIGPLLVLAVAGLLIARRSAATPDRATWLALAGVCLVFMFMVLVPTEANHVLRKSLKILQIPLVVFAVPACAYLLQTPVRRAMAAAVLLVGGLTVFTDIRHYLRPEDNLVSTISRSQMDTLNWVRACTPNDAVVQDLMAVKPGDEYEETFYSGIAAIAERRTLWGDTYHPYLFRADDAAIAERRRLVEPLSVAPTPEALQQLLSRLPMDLLLVDRTRGGPVNAVAALVASGFLHEQHCSTDVCVYSMGTRSVALRCQNQNP